MTNHVSYSNALVSIAKEQARVVLSGGKGLQERLEFIFQNHLKFRPQNLILTAVANFELLKRHTLDIKPIESGMYLKLMLGGTVANEEVEDGGLNGPWIGPLNWFHCTYLAVIGLGFANGEELDTQGYNVDIPSPIYLYQEMIYYDGIYYGGWELQYV
ncbi:hypothetical protein F6R98_12450 [Candidatus Methylospira mobilis]|uniref:Uncharacterized protein n=1 Tax=Candidatus Methylospira mobilis TaxID=1808979 RepID=A0A5Q0BHH7_9GAMM|nr:hypothetical protein [Candidatus Methylospira mobilis]QFY43325.1 hypothetical protein F6R98_12450 [Candidatus Methylospira mobilis]